MKLQANEKQQRHITFMLGEYSDLIYTLNDGVRVDSYLSYDDMAKIVDYLRKEDNTRRIKSCIDKLWVSCDAIFLAGVEKDKAVRFIQSLGALGYDVDKLLEEYNNTKHITI